MQAIAALDEVKDHTSNHQHGHHGDRTEDHQVISASSGRGELRGDIRRRMPGVGRSVAGHESDRAEERGKLTFHGCERTGIQQNVKKVLVFRV